MKDYTIDGRASAWKNVTRFQKSIFLGALILSCLTFANTAHAQYLKAEGKQILDPNGEPIILRGIGLGGWMLQEGYMLRTSGPQHEIEAKIEELIGPDKTEEFYTAWLANHCTKRDIDSMGAWGYNSIRLPMHYKLFTPPIEEEPVAGEITWNEKGFTMVDDLIDWVKANDMYLILDLHAAPGGQGENADISDYDRSKPSLWESKANQDKMIALWKELATRYKDEPAIGAYDIINEPNWGFQDHPNDLNGCAESSNSPLWQLQKDVTAAIREVDQNHIVIIEGNCWGNNYSGLPTLWDENLVISYHKYWNSNEQGSIQGMLDMRDSRNVPIWLGETGENSNGWFTDAIRLFEDNNMGWSWWPLKKMGGNNPLQIEVTEGYQDILDYWSGGAKPSEAEAYASLMEMTENLKVENNTYHPDVVDAMIRQPYSDETLPFKDNTISATEATTLYFVDYDLGKQGAAYYDAEYTNESGNAGGLAWNRGYSYRNDGVDIEACNDTPTNGFNIGWTEDGEWLVYSLNVEEEGAYDIKLRYVASTANSSIRVEIEGSDQTGLVALPKTTGWGETTLTDVALYAGTQKLKFYIEKGGINLNFMEFSKKKY
ncbi:cellulase family glycosylhydrolase [Reichenbachiella ulvae]|uniref:Cellulase family glycosylhydrolase n=1 Tax=Reichenbachiella ulvae TaxID=2980104 RepID=A0ABT3CP76_9BACT|nr:cellulase family glycosylhydrolase [Reichenbachiella ulvae]MCV9385533.1 cellulase family glycosylhydrolase [Reichenbachiella ulvae]